MDTRSESRNWKGSKTVTGTCAPSVGADVHALTLQFCAVIFDRTKVVRQGAGGWDSMAPLTPWSGVSFKQQHDVKAAVVNLVVYLLGFLIVSGLYCYFYIFQNYMYAFFYAVVVSIPLYGVKESIIDACVPMLQQIVPQTICSFDTGRGGENTGSANEWL